MKRKILQYSPQSQKKPKYVRKDENIFIGGEPIKEKETVLRFLQAYYPNLATSGKVIDNITGKEVCNLLDCGYYDGEYYWDETDIYHLEKYNMPINPEFIEYVLSK